MKTTQSIKSYQVTPRLNAGLTMIEVLVTLVILSVGLLGMAAMQVTGIRGTNNAGYRTQASLLANDIAERMRANPAAMDSNLFENINSAAIDCDTAPILYCEEKLSSNTTQAAETCTSAQMAAYDINVWFCGIISNNTRAGGVINSLPQASATITCIDTDPVGGDADTCTNLSPHTISVNWVEPNPQSGGPATINQSIAITIQP